MYTYIKHLGKKSHPEFFPVVSHQIRKCDQLFHAKKETEKQKKIAGVLSKIWFRKIFGDPFQFDNVLRNLTPA